MPSLLVIAGPRKGERIEVDRTLVVGREDADVVIDDPELSRRHLELRLEGRALIVEDLGSTNGTLVKDRAIDSPTTVREGDRVQIGATVLEVQIADSGATRLRGAPDLADATRLRPTPEQASAPPPQASAPPPQASAPPPQASAPPPQASAPPPAAVAHAPSATPPAAAHVSPDAALGLGAFKPPTVRRGGGLASRSWVPVVLSFGTAILVALALVIYFAER